MKVLTNKHPVVDMEAPRKPRRKIKNKDMYLGAICQSNQFGYFKIVSYKNNKEVGIRFLDTGYEDVYSAGDVRIGAVRDRLQKTCCGVGFVGVGEFSTNKTKNLAYRHWTHLMLLNSNTGVRVFHPWFNLQKFSEWFYSLENTSSTTGRLELVRGESYSIEIGYTPETCLVCAFGESTRSRQAKYFKLINCDGSIFEGKNMADFARKNNLPDYSVRRLVRGDIKTLGGWMKITDSN